MKDSSDPTESELKYVTPRMGIRSIIPIGVLLTAMIALVVDYRQNIGSNTPWSGQHVRWLVGLLYGSAAGATWAASLVRWRYLRWLIQTALVAMFAVPIHLLGELPYFRYLSTIGGIVLAQSILFFFLKIPGWQTDAGPLNDRTVATKAQFGIGEVIATTTSVALLLGIVIRYQPANMEAGFYWLTLVIFWLIGPLMTCSLILAILGRGRWGSRLGSLLLTAIAAVVTVVGFTAAQLLLTEIPTELIDKSSFTWAITEDYGKVIAGYLIAVAFFSLAGRSAAR